MKNSLIEMLIENDDDKKEMLYSKFIEEIKRNVVPVIKGRISKRNKGIN